MSEADSDASMLADLLRLGETAAELEARQSAPEGWKPRAEWDTEEGGFIVSAPHAPEDPPAHTELLEEHGLDPANWVVLKARSSKWQAITKGAQEPIWMEASRIEFAPRAIAARDRIDVEQVINRISKWRPRTPATTTERAFWAPMGDTQLGKIEGGGTPATVARILEEIGHGAQRQRTIKAEHVVLPWLGDCVEGIVSQNGKVRGRIDLTITEQTRVLRRLAMAQIKAYAPYSERITVVGIPGNHDETARDLFTVGTDSYALEALSAVEDGIRENPELCERVRFLYPRRDELTVTLEDHGAVVAMAHGHQFGNRQQYWQDWWAGQTVARQDAGFADVLLAAHRHHLRIQDFAGGRVFIQIPAMDGGSQYFDDRYGGNNPSRAVSFTIEDGRIRNLDPVV